jgi:hypothetical protein
MYWVGMDGHSLGTSRVISTFFSGPLDIKFDPMGNMYVADHSNHRIQKSLRY